MKKLISLALALILCVCFTVPAFADTSSFVISSATLTSVDAAAFSVTGTANVTGGATVYYVEVKWDSPTFEWTRYIGVWDPTNLTYSNEVSGSWSLTSAAGTNQIQVTNRSNAPVTATVTATSVTELGIYSVAASFDATMVTSPNTGSIYSDNTAITLFTAYPTDYTPRNVVARFTMNVTGNPGDAFLSACSENGSATILNVTVTISAVSNDA